MIDSMESKTQAFFNLIILRTGCGNHSFNSDNVKSTLSNYLNFFRSIYNKISWQNLMLKLKQNIISLI